MELCNVEDQRWNDVPDGVLGGGGELDVLDVQRSVRTLDTCSNL